MALADLLKTARDHFQSNLKVVNLTFGTQPIYLQPARESLRAAFNQAVTVAFCENLKPIVGRAGTVSNRLACLASAHAMQQPIIATVFPDPVDRDDVLEDALVALQDAFVSVLS